MKRTLTGILVSVTVIGLLLLSAAVIVLSSDVSAEGDEPPSEGFRISWMLSAPATGTISGEQYTWNAETLTYEKTRDAGYAPESAGQMTVTVTSYSSEASSFQVQVSDGTGYTTAHYSDPDCTTANPFSTVNIAAYGGEQQGDAPSGTFTDYYLVTGIPSDVEEAGEYTACTYTVNIG